MTIESKVAAAIPARLGEGACWDAGSARLWWVDILSSRLHSYNPANGEDISWAMDGTPLGTVAPGTAEDGSLRLLVALQSGLHSFDPATGKLRFLCDPEAHLPGNRFNDGKCAPDGRFIAGTMQHAERDTTGSLYRYDPDGSCIRVLENVKTSNGLGFSPDGKTMYYIDTPTRRVDAFLYQNGVLSARRPVCRVEGGDHGYPDGMTVDNGGYLWVAEWNGSRVGCWDPSNGRMVDEVRLPVRRVTSMAFGGADRATLFITTAQDADHPEDKAGFLFEARPTRAGRPVTGAPAWRFGGRL